MMFVDCSLMLLPFSPHVPGFWQKHVSGCVFYIICFYYTLYIYIYVLHNHIYIYVYICYTHTIIQELQDSYDIWNYYIDIHCNIYIAIHTLKSSTYCGWYHVYVIPIRSQGVDTPRKTSAQAHDSSQALSALRQRIKELNTQQLGEGLTWRRRLGCVALRVAWHFVTFRRVL